MKTKKCKICEQLKSLEDFYSHDSALMGVRPECKKCSLIKMKSWYRQNTYNVRSSKLRSKFGISRAEYEEMAKNQNYRCLICSKHQSELKRGLAVDHCHISGQIRGLLCNRCNRGIGMLNDDTNTIENALAYIKLHDKKIR